MSSSLAGSSKLRLISKLLPLKTSGLVLLDSLELQFPPIRVSQIITEALAPPGTTEDWCISPAKLVAMRKTLAEAPVEDLTAWLAQQWVMPQIHVVPLLTGKSESAGKTYVSQAESAPDWLPGFEERCKHGLESKHCSTCQNEEKRRQAPAQGPIINPFDFIFPILQPPLGEDFDNVFCFPPNTQLYPFQSEGVRFLTEHDSALLADEMGLGKSIQTIVALRCLFRLGRIRSALIVSPKSVLADWQRKLWDWGPELRVVKVSGNSSERAVHWKTAAHVHLVTYETLRQDIDSVSADKSFDCLVLDEVQKIKNPSAGITKAARSVPSQIKWGLSGTPLENRIDDLISIFDCLKPGLIQGEQSDYAIKQLVSPYIKRRKKKDALPELPEKVRDVKWLELLPNQRAAYDKAETEGVVALTEQGDTVTVQHVLALITRLKQICNLDITSGESCKLELLREQLEDIADQGDKALVFSQYAQTTLPFLANNLSEHSPLMYHGRLSAMRQLEIERRFRDDPGAKVLLMSLKAGGVGLTLTAANYVIHFDHWWNPAAAAQAEDRTHRIGQGKTVFVTSLLTANTIEERISRILERKKDLFNAVIDDLSDADLNGLTEEELFSLFSLKKARPLDGRADNGNKGLDRADLSPIEFEKLVAALFEAMGYNVRLTPQSRDGGVDVYAKRAVDSGNEQAAIQCKHYPGGVVGVEDARALYGVLQSQPSLTKAFLVTTGRFSKDCADFCRDRRIELFDVDRLQALLKKYNPKTGC